MATPVVKLLASFQLLYSAYCLRRSVAIILKIRQYEGATETAAQYSSIAEMQLQATRKTQGAGVVAIVSSMATAIAVLGSEMASSTLISATAVNAGILIAARRYMAAFWQGKYKVPLVKDFNSAIEETQGLLEHFLGMSIGWVAIGAVGVVGMMAS